MNANIIVKEPTCYKSLNNPSCIDLLITNNSSSFPKYQGNINGVIKFSQNGYNCFKTTFQRSSLEELVYRDYKKTDRLTFKRELEENLIIR